MRLRAVIAAAFFGMSFGVLAHGCTDAQPIDDLCGWVEDPGNCYRTFYQDIGAQCGTPGRTATPTGSFTDRTMLSTCNLAGGGFVTFDTPLDLTHFPLGFGLPNLDAGPDAGLLPPDNITFTITTADGTTCGSGSFESEFYFSISINACPTTAGAIPPLGIGGGGGVGGSSATGFQQLVAASSSATTTGAGGAAGAGGMMAVSADCNKGLANPGKGFVIQSGAFSITQTGDLLDTSCPDGELHHFDALSAEKCEDASQLIPHAEIESSPGSTEADGYVAFRVFYPPATGVPDGGTVEGKQPEVVEYFNCSIPKAPMECADGVKDGAETDVDCGGVAVNGCPARCLAGQACILPTDCANGDCLRNPMTNLKSCNPNIMSTSAAGTGGGGGMGGAGGMGGGG